MQDFFCPKCGRRMLDGKCDCERRAKSRTRTNNTTHTYNTQRVDTQSDPRPAMTEEKIIPFESIKGAGTRAGSENMTSGSSKENKDIHMTLVDKKTLREAEEKERLKKQPWKAPGLNPAKRAALLISHGVSRFTAFVDSLVNPEDE